DVDENPTHFRDSVDFAEQNALAKARRVGEEHRADLIIGSDTVVVLDDHIMGKPVDREDAAEMLGKLSGREHQVVSALALLFPGQTVVESEITRVRFAPLSGREISAYLDTLEPFDKAGAYGIQGFAGLFIAGISGDYYNVIGFPLHRFYQCLKREWGV
ncbi:MAG TPA: Maf family protein, partial [Calditrichia bacterium]|nr:Maf family protein [Calditrichia bacterium]